MDYVLASRVIAAPVDGVLRVANRPDIVMLPLGDDPEKYPVDDTCIAFDNLEEAIYCFDDEAYADNYLIVRNHVSSE